jgi:hypothetical protein
VCADAATVFVRLREGIRADGDKSAIPYFHCTVQLDKPFILASIVWAEGSATQHDNFRRVAVCPRESPGGVNDKGYDGTSMDDVASKAAVSKPTVYKYFSDKERLFAEIVRATTGEIDDLVRLAVETMGGQTSVESGLLVLARRFITALMQPRILRLRRLVMANADRFPDVGRSWTLRSCATIASCPRSDRSRLAHGESVPVSSAIRLRGIFSKVFLIPSGLVVTFSSTITSPAPFKNTVEARTIP